MQSRKKSTNDQPFTQAAQMIIDRMKTPERFTEFLTHCIGWVSDLKTPEPNEISDTNFMVTTLINDLNVPLYPGATLDFEKGFDDLLDCFGPEGYHDHLGVVLEAFGKYANAGYPGEKTWSLYRDGIITLLDLYPLLKIGWVEYCKKQSELDKEKGPNLN
jgi:hypothetical protein